MSRKNFIYNNQFRTIQNDSPIQKQSIKSLQKQLQDTEHEKDDIEEKYQNFLLEYHKEISSYNVLIKEKQQTIEILERKCFSLSQQLKSIHEKEKEFSQKEFIYKQKILTIEAQFSLFKQRQTELIEKVQKLEMLLQSTNEELEHEREMAQKYKRELNQKQTQITANQSEQAEMGKIQNLSNMDSFMIQSLKEQIDNLLSQNLLLKQQNFKYQHQILESRQLVQEIQEYSQTLKTENSKISRYERQINHQKVKNKQLKNKLLQQKEKFTNIMNKNQALYKLLLQKAQMNEKILKQNIEFQKLQTQKLQNLINKYYPHLLTSEKITSRNVKV